VASTALLVPWLLFPLVLALVGLGFGLVLRALLDARIPGPVLLPAGLAAATVVASFTTWFSGLAWLTVPLLVAIAVGGLALVPRLSLRSLDPWAAVCAATAFLAVGAPVVASGEATFAGYVKLDDTATFLALIDRALDHGRDLAGLAPSTYEATLSVNLEHGYPVGAVLPLGIGARLVGTDPAWVYQPYLAVLAALLALCLYYLSSNVIGNRPLRALAAAVASQPALLYGFAMWGGVKELFAAAMLALLAVTVRLAREGWRSALVPAVAAAALLLGLSLGAALWLLPAAVGLVALSRRRLHAAVAGLAGTLALALPTLAEAHEFLRADNVGSFRDGGELGNLIARLRPAQILGIWPSGDFRTAPTELRATYVLLAASVAAAVVGLLLAVRRRDDALLIYVAMCGGGGLVVSLVGSPWLQAKAFAVAGPATLVLALAGASAVLTSARRVEGALLLVALSGGVLWSDALAARAAPLAPHDRLSELETIGNRFAGAGPALITEYQPYGARHFLRRLDAEAPSELRRRQIPLRNGGLAAKGTSPELDELETEAVLVYRILVLPRSTRSSRPPAPYHRAWRGRFYDVWRRPDTTPRVLAHLPLGNEHHAISPAPCDDVLAAARVARRFGGVLVAARAEGPPIIVVPRRARSLCGAPLDWLEVRPS
jgi:hypothetical protein